MTAVTVAPVAPRRAGRRARPVGGWCARICQRSVSYDERSRLTPGGLPPPVREWDASARGDPRARATRPAPCRSRGSSCCSACSPSGWLLTHPLESTVDPWDDSISRAIAEDRTPDGEFLAAWGTTSRTRSSASSWPPSPRWCSGAGNTPPPGRLLHGAGRRDARALPDRHLLHHPRPSAREDPRPRPRARPQLPVGPRRDLDRRLLRARDLPLPDGPASRRWAWILFLAPVVVAPSRLYEGAHHVTDVLTSLVFAPLWVAVGGPVPRLYGRQGGPMTSPDRRRDRSQRTRGQPRGDRAQREGRDGACGRTRPGTAPDLSGVEEHVGDFGDPAFAAQVMAGTDALVTTVHPLGGDRDEQRRIGLDGTLAIATAAGDAGVPLIVHISTAGVYDRSPEAGDVSEESALVSDDANDYSVDQARHRRGARPAGRYDPRPRAPADDPRAG